MHGGDIHYRELCRDGLYRRCPEPEWDVKDMGSCTTQPVLSSIAGNIEYTRVNLPLPRFKTPLPRARQKKDAHDRLNRRDVRTFMMEAGCAWLQPFEDKTDIEYEEISNIIDDLPAHYWHCEQLQDSLEKKVCLNPSSLEPSPIFRRQIVGGPTSVIHIKPDVLRWRICFARLGAENAHILFNIFEAKYHIYLLPTNNSSDRTWARSIWECKYVSMMHDWTHSGTSGVDDADLGYKDLPLLQLKGFFTSEACWWLTKKASAALIAQDYMAWITGILVPFDAFEAMALTYRELLHHFPRDEYSVGCPTARPFPKMRSLASYYYSNQLSRPLGLKPLCQRRSRLEFAHERETYIFVLQAVWHNWKHGLRLFKIPKKTLEGMVETKLNEVPKELLGLPIAPAVIMKKLQDLNDQKVKLSLRNTIGTLLPGLRYAHFWRLRRNGNFLNIGGGEISMFPPGMSEELRAELEKARRYSALEVIDKSGENVRIVRKRPRELPEAERDAERDAEREKTRLLLESVEKVAREYENVSDRYWG